MSNFIFQTITLGSFYFYLSLLPINQPNKKLKLYFK